MIRPLNHSDFGALLLAFNDAFSDYVVPMKLTAEQLRLMLTRRGYVPSMSAGAFEDDRIVAFSATCIDGDLAYDTGTGVVPSHRRQGLAAAIMKSVFDLIGDRAFMLEVVEGNSAAHQLYLGLGFEEVRRFQCWTYTNETRARFTELANIHLHALTAWSDVDPSWQNSPASILRTTEPWVALGDERCAIVFFPSNGDVPLLAVDPTHRRQGLSHQLLAAAATRAAKPLQILNVDDRDEGIAAFLEAAGATRTVRQVEMLRRGSSARGELRFPLSLPRE